MVSLFANVDNSHNAAPIMSSNVGPVQGCGGPANSPDALKQDGVFQMESTGGKYKKRKSSKRRHHSKRRHMKNKTYKRRRHQRGGQFMPIETERTLQAGKSGTSPLVSGTNTTDMAKVGGKSRRRRGTRHRKSRKSRKHNRKHHRVTRRRRAMKGGDGVYAAALTPSYSMPGEADTSSLASPAPFVKTNYCLDSFKHLGDKPPYNEEWKGIN